MVDRLSTDAKILINDWAPLRDMIKKHTVAENQELLTDKQLQDALEGPFQQFFKQQLTAFAAVAKIRFLLTVTQDEIFQESKKNYSKTVLEKISITDLDKIQKALDIELSTQESQWQKMISTWQEQLVFGLTAQDIPLSDLEINELHSQEPLSELWDRFTDLHIMIEKPKLIDFEQYFRLKTYLVIYSALSRRHQPHESDDMQKILKKLKKEFSAIKKDEKRLLAEQQLAIHHLIEPIMPAAR